MSNPIKEVVATVGHVMTAYEILKPLAKSIATYIAGGTPALPPEVPDHLRSEVELAALKARSAKASEPPPGGHNG